MFFLFQKYGKLNSHIDYERVRQQILAGAPGSQTPATIL